MNQLTLEYNWLEDADKMSKSPERAEDFVRNQQDRLFDMLMEPIKRFGEPVRQRIRREIEKKDGLPRLLQRLGIRPPHSAEFQIKVLAAYIAEQGVDNFLQVMKAYQDAPVKTAAKTVKVQPPQAAPEAEAGRLFDTAGRYIGPERRSGNDRRSGIDRRGVIDTIFRNRRYGSDRRQVIRRECDRKQAAELGLTAREFPPPRPAK